MNKTCEPRMPWVSVPPVWSAHLYPLDLLNPVSDVPLPSYKGLLLGTPDSMAQWV